MIRLALIAAALTGCQHWRDRSAPPLVLLFDGTGTSRSDVAAIESLLAESGLAGGVRFHFYSDENRGIRKAAVAIARPREPSIEQYWEDGPELSGWGDVVAKYPDGTPAVVEGPVGRGWAILVGVHPEAPASWPRGMAFATTVAVNRAYAATLVAAALQHTALPHF